MKYMKKKMGVRHRDSAISEMLEVPILKLSILLILAMLITACELNGNAQKIQATPDKQEETNSQKAQEPPKQEEPNSQKGLDNVKTDWLEYEPAVVVLEGKLIIKTYFGPPNFGEDPKTDSRERSWILSLDKPIKVRAKDETDPVTGPSVDNVRELQLVLHKPRRKMIGKKVRVKGTLFHAHTGHHHTDVLMDVESIGLAGLD